MRLIYVKRFRQSLILLIAVIMLSGKYGAAEELMQVDAAIHISSTVSDGKLDIDEIVEIARKNGIKVVILNEHNLIRWQYGLPPLRNIIKKTIEKNSVFKYGIARYLAEVEQVQQNNPDLVIIPGVECAPFYYWQGSPFEGNLKMCNWHKHILVVGLEKVEDYKNIPSVSNRSALAFPFRFKDIYRLWPVLILIIGFFCLRKRKFSYKDLRGRELGPFSLPWRILGTVLIIFGLLFFCNNFPFRELKYDQYHGNQGIKPYQNFIDYVNQRGGLIFWAHPEARYVRCIDWIDWIDKVDVETRPYPQDLLAAQNYTGFAIFREGYKEIGRPGGIWDTVLKQYCGDERENPIWAISELDFDYKGDLNRCMNKIRTTLLVPELTKNAVLEALKLGRIYVAQKGHEVEIVVDEFAVYDNLTQEREIVGGELQIKGKPLIKIKGITSDKESHPVKIKLIRNGLVVKTFETSSPFAITYPDDCPDIDKKTYYRLEIDCGGHSFITNPIFVKRNSPSYGIIK